MSIRREIVGVLIALTVLVLTVGTVLAEPGQQRQDESCITLLLTLNNGRRMGSSGFEIPAIGWTLDLCEAFGATAHGTDLLANRRTDSPAATTTTERASGWTHHRTREKQ